MSKTTARNLGIRLDAPTAHRLSAFETATGVEGTTLGRILLNSALDYFESHGSLPLPLKIVPAFPQSHPSDPADHTPGKPPSATIAHLPPPPDLARAAEEPRSYRTKTRKSS